MTKVTLQSSNEKGIFQQRTPIGGEKNKKPDLYLTQYTHSNSRWIFGPRYEERLKWIKSLEDRRVSL